MIDKKELIKKIKALEADIERKMSEHKDMPLEEVIAAYYKMHPEEKMTEEQKAAYVAAKENLWRVLKEE